MAKAKLGNEGIGVTLTLSEPEALSLCVLIDAYGASFGYDTRMNVMAIRSALVEARFIAR